jgi:N-acyl amino acid synthase of PEP-CTERM/exosortase system
MFDSRFEIFLADTELSKRIHYQIRYRIFCIDTGFEDPGAFQIEEERDQWDDHAVHFLVREKATHQWVATMRLVLADGTTIPMETLCELPFSQIQQHREVSAEVSRLCMVKSYRGRQGGSFTRNQNFSGCGEGEQLMAVSQGLNQRAEPEIMLGLFRAAFAYCQDKAVSRWYFLITRSLARMVNKLGISLEQIGPEVSHRGIRVPYVTNPAKGRQETMQKSEAIAAMLERDIPHYQLFSALGLDHKVA